MLRMRALTATLMAIAMVVREPVWAAPPPWASGAHAAEFAPAQDDAVARRCDLLANPPGDPQRVGAGVLFERINVGEALPACEQAAAREPSRARYRYLYGRVLDAGQRHAEAARQYTLARQAGYVPASHNLGVLYLAGTGVGQNKPHALGLVREGASAGVPEACLLLGALHEAGELGVPHDTVEAAKWYRKAGDAGLAEGYALLGETMMDDSSKFAEMVGWFQRGAEGGAAWAAYRLGELFQFGAGGRHAKDEAMAAKLFTDAAAKGIPEAMYRLGRLYSDGRGVTKDPKAAYRWFNEAALQPRAAHIRNAGTITGAQWELGAMLYNGAAGVPRDARAASTWLLRAAHGSSQAQELLGFMYDTGDGVAQSPSEAVAWYRKAAQADYLFSMTQLGMHLRHGVGVVRNEVEAMQWFRKAAERGYATAEAALGYGYMSDVGGGKKDYPQAAVWLESAARRGETSAQVNLGVLYANGWGVKRDMPRAKQLWSQAAASPTAEFATLARQNLRDAEEAELEAAKARFEARRARERGDPDAGATAGKVAAMVIGGALLFSLLGSGSGNSGAGQSGGKTNDEVDYMARARAQEQVNQGMARLLMPMPRK